MQARDVARDNLGASAGSALGAGSITLASLLPDDQFLGWGWRLPFLSSIVLVTIGLFIRLKVAESPVFQRFEAEAEKRRIPIVDVFTRHPKNLLLGLRAALSQLTISGASRCGRSTTPSRKGQPGPGC